MITLRPADQRGQADYGWLHTRYTFSFADYYDPEHVHFRSLRVINEDHVEPGHGFGTHPHRDMEIITYVLEGALAHKDSMGTGSTIRPGEVQRMSAGTGVLHSEFNYSPSEEVHLLQIWSLPERKSIEPSYEQKEFARESKLNRLRLVASPGGEEGSVTIHQDARLYASILEEGKSVRHELGKGRYAWLQVVRGDGAAVEREASLEITGNAPISEFLLFDLA
jgi:redox-sensitive bicupin YhaK (pirin superfamily)